MPPGRRPARCGWGGRGARSARWWPPLASSRTPRPAPSRPGPRSRSLSPAADYRARALGLFAAAGAGWSDLPAGGRNPGAAAAKLRLLSRRGASRSLLFPPLSAVLCLHRGDYIVAVSARARLSPRSFHLKEETGGQEESVIRHPKAPSPGFLQGPPPPPLRSPHRYPLRAPALSQAA
ncbi:TMF-regulated nuclear protein 1-like [Moschus berezovskii]|uniref:TMF-regulated nuclear protein 1-like n=1 Tax=Moschus berezovskii TaxID=68408 RepID=UPI00244524BD|nr:TMF-regulated nuclear protein 1-like [Moschus berezovskii]